MISRRRTLRKSHFVSRIRRVMLERNTLSNLLKASKGLRVRTKGEFMVEKVEMTKWEASKMIKAKDFLHL